MTWSIVARDAGGAFGVAIATRFFAVGALCPDGESGVGALSTLAPVMGIDERLGGKRADAALAVRAQRADGEEARRDRHAERAARVARHDGPGHGRRS